MSPSIIPSGFIPLVASGRLSFVMVEYCYLCVYIHTHIGFIHTHTRMHMYHIFLIHSSIVEYLGSFHTLAIVNDAKWTFVVIHIPGFPALHYFSEFAQTYVDDAIQPSHPLLLPSPPILNLSQHQGLFLWSALQIRWPTFWHFSVSPSSEYSRLISFRINWFNLLAVQGTLTSLL